MKERVLFVGMIVLFVISSIPVSFGNNIRISEKLVVSHDFDRYLYPEYYDCNNVSETTDYDQSPSYDFNNFVNIEPEIINFLKDTSKPIDGPMNSSWPMFCHDVRHTGFSSYSTVNTWDLVWRFPTYGWACCSPTIDRDGIIYLGTYLLYAVYPNGTLKWECDLDGVVEDSSPAIDENGTIYVGTAHAGNYLHAINTNGTLKWKYPVGSIYSSPVIGDDGTIYFADTDNWNIKALYPNGTLKWSYHTNLVIYSSPAIGLDDTIYCGSHDGNVYALYSNNGTLKWKYNTGSWVHGSPTIADDGTVYIGSDNGFLYAFYPDNGTVKWKINIGSIYGSVALDEDGTIYTGVWEKTFYAIYPNGTIKWNFNTGSGKIWDSSPALSNDGTLYFGTCDLEWTGGIEIIALYTDGTLKWRKSLNTFFSSPAIAEDGTVYIASSTTDDGYLNAFGIGPLQAEANGPYYRLINQPVQFKGSSTGGYSPYSYHWDFGDSYSSDEQNPIHIYTSASNYTVTLTVTDNTSNTSTDTTWAWIQNTNTPPDKPTISGPTKGKPETSYTYTFVTTDIDGTEISYYIDWGDNENTGWKGPYDSGKQITLSHTWNYKGTYTIKCKAKDPYNSESDWETLEIKMPRNRIITSSLFYQFLEKFLHFLKYF